MLQCNLICGTEMSLSWFFEFEWFPHFGLTNFPAFPVIFFIFQYFSMFYLINLQKKLFNKYTSFKKSEKKKKKKWLKVHHFSSILGKIPSLFQSVQNFLTFP